MAAWLRTSANNASSWPGAAGIFDKRLGELLAFAIAVSIHDCVAPERGRRKLADYLREQAAQKV